MSAHRVSHAPYITSENIKTTTNTSEGQAVTPGDTRSQDRKKEYTVQRIAGHYEQAAGKVVKFARTGNDPKTTR